MKAIARSAKDMSTDKAHSQDLLHASDLDWTIVSPPLLTGKPLGSGIRIVPDAEKIGARHRVGHADVTAWMLSETRANAHVRGEVVVST